MSLFNEYIDVRSTTGGHPALFSWRGHVYRVRRVIGSWEGTESTAAGRGSRGDGARLVRVAAESDDGHANIADLTFDAGTDRWTMRRVYT